MVEIGGRFISGRSAVDMPKREKMALISFHLPQEMLQQLEELVRRGLFPNRSEAVRAAIRDC